MGTGFNGGNASQFNACIGSAFNARGTARVVMYAAFFDAADSQHKLARIDPLNGEIIWWVTATSLGFLNTLTTIPEQKALSVASNGDAMLAALRADPVYGFNRTHLVRVALADGSLVWRTPDAAQVFAGGVTDLDVHPVTDYSYLCYSRIAPNGTVEQANGIGPIGAVDQDGNVWVAEGAAGTQFNLRKRAPDNSIIATIVMQARLGSLTGSSIRASSVHCVGGSVIVAGTGVPVSGWQPFVTSRSIYNYSTPWTPGWSGSVQTGTRVLVAEAWPPTATPRWSYRTEHTGNPAFVDEGGGINFGSQIRLASVKGCGFPVGSGVQMLLGGNPTTIFEPIDRNLVRLHGESYPGDVVWSVQLGGASGYVTQVAARQV